MKSSFRFTAFAGMARVWLLCCGVVCTGATASVNPTIRALSDKEAEKRVAAALALGEQGARAVQAVPALVARLRDPVPAVREAVASALARMGAPAVAPAVEMLTRGDLHQIGAVDERTPAYCGLAVLEKLDRPVKISTAIPALAALLAQRSEADIVWSNALEALGRMGPEAVPALVAALDRGVGLSDLALKIGEAARPAIGRMIAAYPRMTYADRWEVCHALAAARPDLPSLPALLQLLQEDDYGMVQDLAVVLDRMGPAVVPALGRVLADKRQDWYPRWGVTMALEMMGPKALGALDALEVAFRDPSEDLDVRVGAARALASLRRTDPVALYQQIPDCARQIVQATREKSAARRQQFMQREALNTDYPPPEDTQGRWLRTAQWVYRLASNQKMDEANAGLKAAAETGWNGSFMDVNLVRAFMLYHSRSPHHPGRLTPQTEAALKQYFFGRCDNQDKSFKQWKEQGQSTKDIKPSQAFAMALHANKPMNFTSRDYLSLSVLKDDPEYRERKFVAGDTVTERYHAWNEYFRQFLKDWALHGLWVELGSSSYEYHTYPSFINLADLAPDPIVRQRARMFLDLCLIEAQQISMADLRAGSKSRAKKGGLGSTFNPYLHLIYGERGQPLYHSPIAASPYQAPEAAILLHKLGAPATSFEIINRQAGEVQQAARNHTERTLLFDSHLVNYAYRTPEYVIGCSMYDPNRTYGHGCEGRWSGVVFRDRAIISLPAYTGEKWNVQSRDVMIAQRCAGAYYTGYARVDFTSGFDKVEREGWVFLDNGEAYAAIKIVTGGYTWCDPVQGSLALKEQYSPIIIQTGRAATYGTFARFQDAILQAPLQLTYADANRRQLHKVEYTGPNSTRVEFCLATKPFILPKVDGTPIDLELEYNYRSPYIESRKGSDLVTVRYGDRRWDYDFANNTVTAHQ